VKSDRPAADKAVLDISLLIFGAINDGGKCLAAKWAFDFGFGHILSEKEYHFFRKMY
jgi:hypothetical protein